MEQRRAFNHFKLIDSLGSIVEKHKEWLKDYEGLYFSIGENKKDMIHWSQEKENYIYADKRFDEPIECLDGKYRANPNKFARHPSRLVIEFDDEDLEKIKEHLIKIKSILKEHSWGYIESTHGGKSNYIWIEFNKKISDKQAKEFLQWICPEGAMIDLNFASSNRRLPVLFAEHWKYPRRRELPVEFVEGNQIDISAIKSKLSLKNQDYLTYKKSANVFTRIGQAEQFIKGQPMFYDKAGLWWMWNKDEMFWELTDEVDVLNMIEKDMNVDVIASKERNEILNSLKQVGRRKMPLPIKPTWIQFRNEIFDIQTGETFQPTPEYFVTNPIPYCLHKDKFMNTPVMDRIFEEWVGKENVLTLHQIIAYCLLPSYPLNRLFCFIGSGLNGKSKFLELLCKFIGEKNVTSTELDTLLNSRFEVTRLHKKLVCQMGETNFNEISKTSILKKLTGGDMIGFEYKNKNPFHDKNYAKILISTNNLPATTDKSIGFYRRWFIIDFPNQFNEQKNILDDIPEEEYECLALKSCFVLKALLDERRFHNEGTIEDRMEKYESKSEFLSKFVKESTIEDINSQIIKTDFFKKFSDWCKEHRHRQMSELSVNMRMKELGYETERVYFQWMFDGKGGQTRCFVGIKWKE